MRCHADMRAHPLSPFGILSQSLLLTVSECVVGIGMFTNALFMRGVQ